MSDKPVSGERECPACRGHGGSAVILDEVVWTECAECDGRGYVPAVSEPAERATECEPAPAPAPVEWAWRETDGEEVFGPFESRETAVVAAREYLNPDPNCENRAEILVGPIVRLRAEDVVGEDLGCMLYSLNEALGPEFEGYEITAKPGADSALLDALKAWAAEWCECSAWVMDEEKAERVRL
jgi:hypothetical protein